MSTPPRPIASNAPPTPIAPPYSPALQPRPTSPCTRPLHVHRPALISHNDPISLHRPPRPAQPACASRPTRPHRGPTSRHPLHVPPGACCRTLRPTAEGPPATFGLSVSAPGAHSAPGPHSAPAPHSAPGPYPAPGPHSASGPYSAPGPHSAPGPYCAPGPHSAHPLQTPARTSGHGALHSDFPCCYANTSHASSTLDLCAAPHLGIHGSYHPQPLHYGSG